jgi:hypothetical protein
MYVRVKELPSTLRGVLERLGYTRDDIEVRASATYSPSAVSGDGFRAFVAAVNLVTGESKVEWGSWGGPNMFNPTNQVDLNPREYPIPENFTVIKGRTGGSRPMLATVYANEANLQKLLPSGKEQELSLDELIALNVIKKYKASYRRDYFEGHSAFRASKTLGKYSKDNPLLVGLAAKGLIKITGAGIQITTEGRNAVDTMKLPEGTYV